MHPTLLRIGSFELSTYGVLVAAAYLAAILYLKAHREAMRLSEDAFWDLVYWLFGGALLGGKLGYVIVERDITLFGPRRALRLRLLRRLPRRRCWRAGSSPAARSSPSSSSRTISPWPCRSDMPSGDWAA